MMKPNIKARWVAALRSGTYAQGKGTLHNEGENTFCCLGVLCDIEDLINTDTEVLDKDSLHLVGLTATEQDVLAYLNDGGDGILDIDNAVKDLAVAWGITRENMTDNRSFKDIANIIEKHL